MHTKLFITTIIIVFTIQSFAQQGMRVPDYEKLKAEKVAYISTQIDFSVEDAQVFWPIYNEFDKKNNELLVEEHKLRMEMRTNDSSLTDDEIEKTLDRMIAIDEEKSKIRSEYHIRFKKILTIKQLMNLYRAENGFRRTLLHRYGKGRHGMDNQNEMTPRKGND